MSTKDYSTTLLDMEDIIVKNIDEHAREITIELDLQQRVQLCPACGAGISRVHDYHNRTIRDLDLRGKRATLHYRRRRYLCPECGKRFPEKCSFAGRYKRFTHRVAVKAVDLLRRRSSLKAVAEATGTSLSGVNRILNTLTVPKPEALPEAISFDEFRGNLGGERFQCIVTDPLNRLVLDILPKRTVESMQDYLRPLVVRTSPAFVREFCYPSLYTPTFDTEPIKGRGIEGFVPAWLTCGPRSGSLAKKAVSMKRQPLCI